MVMIGDQIDTDILGASRAGLDSALMLSGVSAGVSGLAGGGAPQPTYILNDLSL